MNLLSVSRGMARRLAAQSDPLERVRQEIVAAAARLLPSRVLVPIRVVSDRQKTARARD